MVIHHIGSLLQAMKQPGSVGGVGRQLAHEPIEDINVEPQVPHLLATHREFRSLELPQRFIACRATIPQLSGSAQMQGHVGVTSGLHPQLDASIGPDERLTLVSESLDQRPVVECNPMVAWVEGFEGASRRGVHHGFGLVSSPVADESEVHREVDLVAGVAFGQSAGDVEPPGTPWRTPPGSRRERTVVGDDGFLETHRFAGSLPGRHVQWTDLLGDFSFETLFEVTNAVLGELGVIMHGHPQGSPGRRRHRRNH